MYLEVVYYFKIMCLYWLCYSFKSKKFWFINLVILSSKLCQDYILDDKSILILWKDSMLFFISVCSLKRIPARIRCDSFYNDSFLYRRYILLGNSCFLESPFSNTGIWYVFLHAFVCAICTDSSSNASQRELTLMSWTAS